MFKKSLASVATAFLILAGSVTFGASAANATYEECVPVEAWTEVVPDIEHPAETHEVHHEAVYESVLVTPAVEYQAAVYEIEYKFVHKFDPWHTNPKWKTDRNWNADGNPNSWGWYFTGETRNGKLISAEVLAQDAVYENKLVSEAWTEIVVDKEAWTEVVPDIEHPAVTCPEDPEEPVFNPANPKAKLQASCGLADVHLKNPTNEGTNLTASFIVNVDGEFYGAYAVESEDVLDFQITFPEDSGTHSVEVFQAGTSEYKSLAEVEVNSDCEPPVVVVPEQPEETVTVVETSETDCDTQTVTTTTTTTTSGRTVYNEQTNTWDPIADDVQVASSERPATETECPVVTPTPDPTDTPEVVPAGGDDGIPAAAEADGLAATGMPQWVLNVLPYVGGALLVVGALCIRKVREGVMALIRRFRPAHNN